MSSNKHQWSMIATRVRVYGLGVDPRRPTIDCSGTPFPVVSAGRGQIPQPNEVVRGDREGEHPRHPLQTAMTKLSQSANGLQPTEDLFHALPLPLANLVSRVARSPPVDGTASVFVVLGDMRCDVQCAPVIDQRGGVIVLIAADGHAALTGNL